MFFKKPVNINFITVLIVVLLLIGLGVVSGCAAMSLSYDVSALGGKLPELWGQGDNPAAGWGVLLTGFAGLTVALVTLICWAVAITASVMAALIFIPILAARLVYRNTGGRLLAYRILMGIDYFLLTLLTLMLSSVWLEDILGSIVFLPFILILAAIIAVNIINTYTDRIKRDGRDKAQ